MLFRLVLWAMTLILNASVLAGVQDQDAYKVPPDPYLKGDPGLLKAAGFVDAGRFSWGDGHGTKDIEELLGSVPLRWLETAHFKIGSSMPAYTPDKNERSSIKAELARLGEKIPGIKSRTKTIDPWLRLYLYAQRLEEFYATLATRLGVEESLASGMIPGVTGKFCVLLLEKKSSLGRYGTRYGSSTAVSPLRVNYPKSGSLGFVTCTEFFEGDLAKDVVLHCQLVWGVCQNMLSGYLGYNFTLPRWLADGTAYWCQRQIDPQYPTFSALSGSKTAAMEDTGWPRKVRARVKVEVYAKTAQMVDWLNTDPLPFADHMMMFSRADYLLSSDDNRFARFMRAVKQPLDAGLAVPGHELVRERVNDALSQVYGFDAAGFDEVWAAWVLKTYPRR
ncbi:MAG: hypothetical protein ACI9EF_000366 [Pseudohongiellaceae bacterium]|jgi:hypothetical protein